MKNDCSKPRFVFIHGVGATHSVWRHQRSAFEDSIALDLPGHPSGKGCNSILDYSQFVTETIFSQAISQTILVGHSMGGAIAIEVAITDPKLLVGVVLVDTGARLRVNPAIKEEVRIDYRHAAEMIVHLSLSPKNDGALREASIRELLEVPADVTYGDLEACDNFDRMNDVSRISLPTLIVCGEDDMMTPVKYSRYLKERIDDARYIVIPDAGHSVMLEKPEALNRVLRAFQAEILANARFSVSL